MLLVLRKLEEMGCFVLEGGLFLLAGLVVCMKSMEL